MQRSLERSETVLTREPSEYSTCLFTTRFGFMVGSAQTLATGYVDQMFGTDSILDTQSRRMSGLRSRSEIHYSQFGPITGFSEGLVMRIEDEQLQTVENLLATSKVLCDLDGWTGYQLKKLKGLRPKGTNETALSLDTVIRELENKKLIYICGEHRVEEHRTVRIELNYLTNSLSIFHHYLTGCLPAKESHELIRIEEEKEPEERFWRFLTDLWTASNGELGCVLVS